MVSNIGLLHQPYVPLERPALSGCLKKAKGFMEKALDLMTLSSAQKTGEEKTVDY